MKIAALIAALLLSANAFAGLAYFTGRQEMVQTVTYKMVWRCQYNHNGTVFWQLFEGMCPANVNVL